MRCKACDTILEDRELKRKDKQTGEYLDLCDVCFSISEEAIDFDFMLTDDEEDYDYDSNVY